MRFIVLFWCGLGLLAQDSVSESMTVVYKEVRVHVVDENGQPTPGLKPHNFQLKVNGEPVEHSFFQEVKLTQAEEKGSLVENDRRHFMLIFLDSSQMGERNFAAARDAAQSLIEKNAGGETYIKLMHVDGGVRELGNFTNRKDMLLGLLNTVTYNGSLLQEHTRDNLGLKDTIETQNWALSLTGDGSGDELNQFAKNFEHMVTNSFQKREKGKFKHYLHYHDAISSQAQMFNYLRGDKSVWILTGGQFGQPTMADTLNKSLNTASTTVYTLMFDAAASARFDWQESNYDRVQLTHDSKDTAVSTGGIFAKTSVASKARQKLTEMETISNHFYRMAFAVPEGADELELDIQLKDTSPELTLHYGSKFKTQAPYQALSVDNRRLALDAMLRYSDTFIDELNLETSYAAYARSGGGYRIPVFVGLSEEPVGNLEFALIAFDEEGGVLDQTLLQLETKTDERDKRQYYDLLLTDAPPSKIRISVRDMGNGARSFLEILIGPETLNSAERGGISTLAVNTTAGQGCLALNRVRTQRIQKRLQQMETALTQVENTEKGKYEASIQWLGKLLGEEQEKLEHDPFLLGKQYFIPALQPSLPQGSVQFLFHLDEVEDQDFQLQFLVKHNEQTIQAPVKLARTWRAGIGKVHYVVVLEGDHLEQGNYEFLVRAVDKKTRRAHTTGAHFSIRS